MDHYRARLKAAGWDWMEQNRTWRDQGRLVKDRVSGRAEKRGARQEVRAEIANDNADTDDAISADPCRNGSCAFCHDGGRESEFERTRMAAAQRGAI